MQTKDALLSTKTVHLIREEKTKTGDVRLIDAWMPVGKGFGKGNDGAIDWINKNLGWQSYDDYMAKKNSAEAEAKRVEAASPKEILPAAGADGEKKGKK